MAAERLCRLRVEQFGAPQLLTVLRENPQVREEMAYPSFFCSPGWLDAVVRVSEPTDPFGFLVFRDDTPIAVLPVEKVRNWLGGYDIHLLGHRFHPDPLGLICAASDRRDAITALIEHLPMLPKWDRLILDYMLPEEAGQWPGDTRQQSVAPYLVLPRDFETLLARFNGKKRYKLRAKIRRADEANLEFTVADSVPEKALYLDALFELHERRSRAIGRRSSLRRRHVRTLHSNLLSVCPEARLFALRHESLFVAVSYGFLSHARFFFYQVAHDPSNDELRPGTVIVARTIAHACDEGASEFNFLQGAEEYKFEWTSDARQLMQVRVTAPRIRAKVLNHAEGANTHLRRAFRKLSASFPL